MEEHPSEPPEPSDPTPSASEAEALAERLEGELRDVEKALQRLDEGTYWRCEVCGEPIEAELLAAEPTARRCVRHVA